MKKKKNTLKSIVEQEIRKILLKELFRGEPEDTKALNLSYVGPFEKHSWLGMREITNRDLFVAIMRIEDAINDLNQTNAARHAQHDLEDKEIGYKPAPPAVPAAPKKPEAEV
tara:strand:- start:6086 stop:6421 length:336 start_codon:yes stop_codon:yes gene_type:complete